MTLTAPAPAAGPARASRTGVHVVAHATLTPVGLAHAAGPHGARLGAGPVEDWVDLRDELGRGHRHLPVPAQLALGAGRRALAPLASSLDAVPAERRELVVASSCGAAGTHARMDATILTEGARLLSPLGAPHFSVNLLGAQLSAELAAQGAATTFTTTTTAVVDALRAGTARLHAGRCDLVVVVAVEHGAPLVHRPGAETGALALVLARTDGPIAAPAAAPALRVVRRTWRSGALPAALAGAVADLVDRRTEPVEVTVLVDPRAAHELAGTGAGLVRAELPGASRVRVGACGHGAFLPAAGVLDAVRRAGRGSQLVLVVGDRGRLAGVRVDPGQDAGRDGTQHDGTQHDGDARRGAGR